MIKKIFISIALIVAVQFAGAQNINFAKGSWEEILSKSKAENKLIFVDIYAVWCGPCKAMAKNVFTQSSVANKYNSSFINFMVDAEKGEGIGLAEKYKVESFPTYLFIDASGNLIHKIDGALPADKFLHEADTALKKIK
jgi:thiol:disulfide interchange protein